MKTYLKIFITACLLIMMSGVWAANQKTSEITTEQSNKAIFVTPTQPVVIITLPANPTTGYSWYLKKYPTDFIVSVGSYYQAPQSKLVGAGGTTMFTFKFDPRVFQAPHLFAITLIYAQAWNLQHASEKTVYIATQPEKNKE